VVVVAVEEQDLHQAAVVEILEVVRLVVDRGVVEVSEEVLLVSKEGWCKRVNKSPLPSLTHTMQNIHTQRS